MTNAEFYVSSDALVLKSLLAQQELNCWMDASQQAEVSSTKYNQQRQREALHASYETMCLCIMTYRFTTLGNLVESRL